MASGMQHMMKSMGLDLEKITAEIGEKFRPHIEGLQADFRALKETILRVETSAKASEESARECVEHVKVLVDSLENRLLQLEEKIEASVKVDKIYDNTKQ